MTIALRVVAKQHRVELTLATLLALAMAVAAAIVTARLIAADVPPACVGMNWDIVDDTNAPCLSAIEAFMPIAGEAGMVFAGMVVVPLIVGLLAGVPVVGREIESGTAQFSWAIAPSRLGWLARQGVGVGVVSIAAISLAGVSTQVLHGALQAVVPGRPFDNVGLFGWLIILRSVAALSIGLLVGALVGRTLPAFIVGGVIALACVAIVSPAREAWAQAQPLVAVEQAERVTFDGQMITLGWIDPTGDVLRYEAGIARAPAEAPDPDMWLGDQGYRQVALGMSRDVASAWPLTEGAFWLAVGLTSVTAAAWVTARRRPT
jgi:hypothetical protein